MKSRVRVAELRQNLSRAESRSLRTFIQGAEPVSGDVILTEATRAIGG